MAFECNEIKQFTRQRKSELQEANDGIDILSKISPPNIVNDSITSSITDSALGRFEGSPITQLGNDFLAEQVSLNSNQILNNVQGTIEGAIGTPLRKLIDEAQKAAFNAVSAALTAKNDLMLFFIQNLARQAISAIDEKREILDELKERVRLLHNALKILVAGQPFFNQYLADLRTALIRVDAAKTKLTTVRNTLDVTDVFLNTTFNSAKEDLEAADALLVPEDDEPDIKFTTEGLLENVGIPSDPQQLTVMLSIPQLSRDVVLASTGYFSATFRLNALLLAFSAALDTFQTSRSQKLKDFTLDMFDNIDTKLQSLVERMAQEINGDPTFINNQVENYNADAVKVSGLSVGWLLELRSIIEMVNTVPGKTFESVQLSDAVVQSYRDAVEAISEKDDRTQGNAILSATDGREDVGQLEQQITLFVARSLQAIVDADVADTILSLGQTVIARLDLSIAQDTEIKAILQNFVNQEIPFFDDLQRTGNGIFNTLNNFGLDRAAAALTNGEFGEFFNMNTKTATFAGAALTGIAVLKQCLNSTEDQEQLDQAQRVIERSNKSKELLAQRGATIGFDVEKAKNDQSLREIQTIEKRSDEARSKCGLEDALCPPNLVDSLGSFVGLGSIEAAGSLLGGGGSNSLLNKIGRGIL